MKVVVGWLVVLSVLWPLNVAAQQKKRKPLPTKQNPMMVGKRDINNNQINFYSLEKEVAFGQQSLYEFEDASQSRVRRTYQLDGREGAT